jgi:SAM-dependent methyltransferase
MMTLPTDKTWRTYGKKEPYFGVFGQMNYLKKSLGKKELDLFFSSGKEYVVDIFSLIRDKIDHEFKTKSILDFGCGPGRMIIPFSDYAKEVWGLDISEHMLEEATKNCQQAGVHNVKFLLADERLQCISGTKYDLVHSFIVLQHLNTSRGKRLFQLLTDHITGNGIGVLHILYFDSYRKRRILNFFRFRIPLLWFFQRILSTVLMKKSLHLFPQMQMNNSNLNNIFAILQHSGIREVVSLFTDHHDYWGVILCFKKPDSDVNHDDGRDHRNSEFK